MNNEKGITDFLITYSFPHKFRLGNIGDGGYVIAELNTIYDCYISAGVSSEESFSRDFINKYGMTKDNSFAFDGTINDYPYEYTKKITYVKKNISNINNDTNTDLGYLINNYSNIFLKMDIEGGEYPWLLSLNIDSLKNIKQIAIEIHGIMDNSYGCLLVDKIKCLKKLAETHYIVHAHGNNWASVINGIPNVIELTYINKSYFDKEPNINTSYLPILHLDYPNKNDIPDIPLNIYPFIQETQYIPNIAHFVFGLKPQDQEFLFVYYLAVYSCFLVNNPDTIYFYYHYNPYGKWWEELQTIKTVKLIKIDLPTHIGKKEIKKYAHKADKVRMDVLFENGGVYLDIDTICIRPYKNFLNNRVLLGLESPYDICNAIMFTEKNSEFFKLWIDKYEEHFNPDGWNESSIKLPFLISKQHPELLRLVSQDVFFKPLFTNVENIFENEYNVPNNLISLHLWEHCSMQYLNEINDWSWADNNPHTLYGKVMLQLQGVSQEEIVKRSNSLKGKRLYRKFILISDRLKEYLTKEPYTFAKNLEQLGWTIIELSKLDIKYITSRPSVILCVVYDDFDISPLKTNNTYLIYKVDDLFYFTDRRRANVNTANIIIGPYQYLFNTEEVIKMCPNIINIPSYHIPYSAVDEYFEDITYNNNPINKIFIGGALSDDIYPLISFIRFSSKFKQYIETLDHPSYDNYKHNIINKEYYKYVNKYICSFTDASKFKYILLKVFEICSVGTLLLIEDSIKNDLNNLGLYDNEHCIMCNRDTMEDKIKWILDPNNTAEVDRIRNNGMTLVRKIHTTKIRANTFDILVKDKIKPELYFTYKNTFDNIYKKGIWNNNDSSIPLSGPGSSINATKDIAKELNDFIYQNNCKSILDLGCGDLTWIKNTQFFKDSHIEYTGVDIVETLINNHKIEHINNKFICSNIITFYKNASLVIIRDVIFHLKINDIEHLFNNIKGSFEYIAITSCNNDINTDNLNYFHFSERNLFKPPFNIPTSYEIKVDESRYNRAFYIFSHDNFYKLKELNILVSEG